jgi:hypothetical protein
VISGSAVLTLAVRDSSCFVQPEFLAVAMSPVESG